MELEEGMYVRTDTGYIFKLGYYDKKEKRWMYFVEGDWYPVYESESELAKASHNIIDLIEENDYIRIISSAFFEPVYYSYGKLVIRDDIPIENYSNNFIAEVITHEQMKNMSYKVGE